MAAINDLDKKTYYFMNESIMNITGWDINSHTLNAICIQDAELRILQKPFSDWASKEGLINALKEMIDELGLIETAAITLTTTATAFRSKRAEVAFILNAIQKTMSETKVSIFGADGQFHPLITAYDHPLLMASTNWLATAMAVAHHIPDGVLVDVGEATTNILPFIDGQVIRHGFQDSERLIRGELIYTGVLRTPVCGLVQRVPLKGEWCPVASAVFATTQDVHLLLSNLTPKQCTSPTPDGHPTTRDFSAERLARMVCADAEILSRPTILTIAQYIEQTQIRQVTDAITQIMGRIQLRGPIVAVGKGAFLAEAAAKNLGLACVQLTDLFGGQRNEVAAATAVAYLLQQHQEKH